MQTPLPSMIIFITISLIIGSFANVVIMRLPIMLYSTNPDKINLALPNSFCINCKNKLSWFLLIPLVSYIWVKGKSSCCKQHIPIQYPIVELLHLISYMIIVHNLGINLTSIWLCSLVSILIIIACIDAKTQLIPDVLNYLFLWASLFGNAFNLLIHAEYAILGAIFAYSVVAVFAKVFHALQGHEGIGRGDYKLIAGLGALLGPHGVFPCLACASLLALIFHARLLLHFKKNRRTSIAFGPFLSSAAILTILYDSFNFIAI